MAFDAGMLACTLAELRKTALGARIEKVFQPERDEIVLQMRSVDGGKRLLINAGSNNPRIGFTGEQKENPMTPPMLCMLLRKHLQGAKLSAVRQAGFERVAILEFETRDEMGFSCTRYLIAELMGKYSNLIFANGEKRVVAALRTVDFTTSSKRQVLPGMTYELPPTQEKRDPIALCREDFCELYADAPREKSLEKWISASFLGISAAVAREIAFRAGGRIDVSVGELTADAACAAFFEVTDEIRTERFSPCMILADGKPVEYAFCELQQYGRGFEMRPYESAGQLLDDFFHTRDRENHIRQRAADILRILTNADNRLRKKLELQRVELADCERGEEYKKSGDLITANLYQLSRGMAEAELTDYEDWHEDGSFGTVKVALDTRLSPASNAQVYYKKYNKSKNAKVELARQIALGEEELRYIDTVFDSLTHAETAADLAEIRDELYRSGYASRMKNYAASRKPSTPTVAEFRTSGGYRVLCGKNNLQNEYITHKLARKNDYWFHVKNLPGSHTVMLCDGEEPDAENFTEAAEIAAYFSKGADGQNVEVDYTYVRNVKKPAGTKPGFVIYHTNWSCIVTPNEARIKAMRVKK
ncbi:MAG: fibronectin/fibrinogen-binding protein [Ruminococcaceae bacterium]|nr:fibronectin/fibrinogen-binding protein [Oscillospiraceae bacterium]